MRVIAVDWSGRAVGERHAIWLAEARDGDLVRLENGRTRDQVADHVLALAADDRELVVGFDFSFSLPAWFSAERGFTTVDELWDAAARDGERWLRECTPPFWGRPGHPRPDLTAHWRATETAFPAVGGVRPKSTFQIGGAGTVGTGSIRGFPILARLRGAGFSIWPFDPAGLPLAIEVWPRACTGAVVKSDPAARAALLDDRYPGLSGALRDLAMASEDAFDAAVTAQTMSAAAHELRSLQLPTDPAAKIEGWTWAPRHLEVEM